jgi:hypothetical protein
MSKRKRYADCHMIVVEENREPVINIVYDGRRIAKRAHRDSPQARTWISLEPGSQVLDGARADHYAQIIITHNGVPVQ